MAGIDASPRTSETHPGVELDPIQLVAPDGTPTSKGSAARYRRDLPPETLAWLYESMVVTRELDTEFVNLQRQGELALFASCRGQEATQIGTVACLPKTDWLFPQYREIGAFLLRGLTPAQMGAVWRGKWHGGLGFTEKCVAPISIPIGTQGLHAVGAAMAAERLGEDSVTLTFLGDGATSEGDAHEALNFAAVFKAPCIFVVQNNHWAISVPVSRQQAGPSIAHRAIGYGMPGIRVDGNDVLACYAVTEEAARRARDGGGPTLIEAVTYRMGPHTTSDDPTRYRSDEELEYWAARDPIQRYRTYLQAQGVWTERLEGRIAVKSQRLRAELRESVVDADDFDITDVFDTVYHDITQDLLAQRKQVLAEIAMEDLGERWGHARRAGDDGTAEA
ncbi:MAG: pyruvate dehydrogenase (acetyl-transferring) E1 component subunit alpha [Mycobacterium sp.]